MSETKRLKIGIVGAGPSGLCCAKHALDYGYDVRIFEQNASVGGTWIYTNQTGIDEFGLPIHSSMYKGVVTNIPIESMGFLNYPFPKKHHSFVPHEEVLAFFQSYANKFDLNRIIKFRTQVISVRPIKEDRWAIFTRDIRTNICEMNQFDAIFLCNGHYSHPSIPQYDGLNEFLGKKIHSHDYRQPNQFRNEIVLIIGAGPSGKDIMQEIAVTAERIIWSHHRDLNQQILPSNVKQIGDVKRFTSNSVQFVNGDEDTITCILFCTGYKFSFPFLSVDCGLNLTDMYWVHPLYKHILNINRPTMAIIGLQICAYTIMYDLQACLCLRYWSGEISMPSKQQMLEEFHIETERRKENANNIRRSHLLNDDQTEYLRELSRIQFIKIPEVLLKIYNDCNDLRIKYPNNYREFNYTIIDDETFECCHNLENNNRNHNNPDNVS